ncbi:MAG: FmdB family zinc ribbon protein [Planctomycetota bacterium]
MPVYEYRCKKCGKMFEILVFGTPQKIKCENCGSKQVKRLLSTFGIGGENKGSTPTTSPSSSGCSSSSCGSCSGCS